MKKKKRRAPGAGHVYRRGAGYVCRWTRDGKTFQRALLDSDGRRITNKEQAEAAAVELMTPWTATDRADRLAQLRAREDRERSEADRLMREANPPPGIASAWFRFEAHPSRPDCGERTLSGYAAHFEDFTAWLARERPEIERLHDVSEAAAQAYAAFLAARKLAPGTFNQRVNLLSMMWRVLGDAFQLDGKNPWTKDHIARKKLQPLAARKEALTPGQFKAVLAAAEADPDARDLLTLLGWTGLRLADGVLLKWASVDFETNVLTVAPMKTARRSGKQVCIPIFSDALEVLNRRSDGKVLDGRGYVFPELAESYERDNSAIPKRLRAFFERAGLSTSAKREGRARAVVAYGAHSLRHFFATQAAAAGIPETIIRDIMGHGSTAMAAHYRHITPELVAKFSAALGDGERKGLPSGAMPLPPWARELIEGMTETNWARRRDALLLAGGE